MKRLAILASGNGTNLQAILDAIEKGRLAEVQVSVVVSNRRAAYALERARACGIPILYHPLSPYRSSSRSRREYDADLAELLAEYSLDLIVLAGWMHILSMAFLQHYPQSVINIHPALPGTFPGMHGIEEAFAAYQRGEIEHTGLLIHFVPDEGVDVGPAIMQQQVPIHPQDSLADLEARMHAVEHELYVRAIAKVLHLKLAA